MSETVPSFLDAVRARRAEIGRLRVALDAEDQELAIAERVAERLEPSIRASYVGSPPAALAAPETGSTVTNAALAATAPKTQPELVISTLKASADPWFESSAALHDEVQRIHGVDIKSGSLLPVLTGLKNDGIIVREGPKIALAERLPELVHVHGVGPRVMLRQRGLGKGDTRQSALRPAAEAEEVF